MDTRHYEGLELDLFTHAHNWKAYWSSLISSYLGDDVLEVGAGIGTNTKMLSTAKEGRWLCLEPDAKLAGRIPVIAEPPNSFRNIEVQVGTLNDLPSGSQFDSIVYIDVLEHIERDADELEKAATFLRPRGNIVVLSPAHQQLFSEFDESIGHFRRYNKESLLNITPDGLMCTKMIYLDSVGMFASISNRFLLRSEMPTIGQIKLWDSFMVPISTYLDPVLFHSIGKSIFSVWTVSDEYYWS